MIIQSIGKLRRQAEKRNENIDGGRPWRVLDFMVYLVAVMLAVFAIRAVIVDPVRVDGTSMLDTLIEGEIMGVDRLAYTFSTPKRGDVVICYYPDDYYTQVNKTYASRVKRIVAVAGDTIETSGGNLLVNGEAVKEPYLTDWRVGYQQIDRQTVPEGCVYVLGDNRSVSIDSRNPAVGPIPYERVIGKVRLVIYPFDRIRRP